MITSLCNSCFTKTTTEGVWLLDDSHKTMFVNSSMAEMLGLSAEEIQNQSIFGFMDEESQINAIVNLELCRQGMKLQQDLKFRCKDGSDLWTLVSTSPMFNPSGKYTGVLAVITDISERKAYEEALRQQVENLAQANRTKDQFLAIVAHELRTPLTAILGWSEVLLSGKLDEATTIRVLKNIRKNAQLQNQLIEDLLDVSRMIRGKLQMNFAPINLVAVISSAIETVRPVAQAKNIQIESVIDLSVDKILGDCDRLQQVLWNLLSNAIKFTPEQGRVEIRLEKVGSFIQIQVKDTGIGIDADFLPLVFDAFAQADTSSKRGYSGLGLGLMIVREIVQLHNGTIIAASEGQGKGATFTVQLPIEVTTSTLPNIDLPLVLPKQEKQEIKNNISQLPSSRKNSCAVSGADLLMSYVAYYVSRGKTVISPLTGPYQFQGLVYHYNGYHLDFQDFWKELNLRRDFQQLYMEGDICCFGDFLNGSYFVSECARCNLPIPTVEGHAYGVPICTLCDDCLLCDRANYAPGCKEDEDELAITRVLAIGKAPSELIKLNKWFFANGFLVNFVPKPEEITPELLRLKVDMVLIHAEISEAEGKALEEKLRRYPQLEDVPIIALTAEAKHSLPWLERTLGLEDYLLAPLGGDRLANHLRQVYQPVSDNGKSSLHWFPR